MRLDFCAFRCLVTIEIQMHGSYENINLLVSLKRYKKIHTKILKKIRHQTDDFTVFWFPITFFQNKDN